MPVPLANPRQIIELLIDGGFTSIAPGTFYNAAEGLLIFDLYPKNVKFSDGNVLPIDPVFQRATPEFARFIASNYARLPDYQHAEAWAWDVAS